MRMDILKEFTSLARNLNFSTTARELYITQSTLSKHIALLEKELGAVLFARDSHKVELTEAGTLSLEDAAPIVRAYDLALEHLDAYKNRTPSRLRVGYLYGATRRFFSPLYKHFTSHNPDVELELVSLEHNDLIQGLSNGTLDLILTEDLGDIDHGGHGHREIYLEHCCAVMAADHPLARHATLTLSQIAGETIFTASSESSAYAAFLQRALTSCGIEAQLVPVFNNFSEIAARVETSRAITISPSHLAPLCAVAGSIVFVPLTNAELAHEVGAFWRPTLRPDLVRRFMRTLDELEGDQRLDKTQS